MGDFWLAVVVGTVAAAGGALFGRRGRARRTQAVRAAAEPVRQPATAEAAATQHALQREPQAAQAIPLAPAAPVAAAFAQVDAGVAPLEVAAEGARLTHEAHDSAEAIDDVLRRSHEVGEQVTALADSLGETSLAVDEMTFGSLEVAKSIEDLSRTCEETAASMVEMDTSIDNVDQAANETSRISAQVSQDADTGARALHQTIAGIHRIREGNLLATEVIRELDEKIFTVTKILGVIDDVAEQTNLLALNAAIIAAQAGEHGRGFAVVADEIKALAERTGDSTKEIAELILTMQEQSRRATDSMAQGLANVEDGVTLGHNAGEALHKIVDSAKRSTGMTESIAQATVEQAQRSKQVTDAISRIAETVAQIAFATAEQAKGAQHLGQSTTSMRQAVTVAQRSVEAQQNSGERVMRFLRRLPEALPRLWGAAGGSGQGASRLAAPANDGVAPPGERENSSS